MKIYKMVQLTTVVQSKEYLFKLGVYRYYSQILCSVASNIAILSCNIVILQLTV